MHERDARAYIKRSRLHQARAYIWTVVSPSDSRHSPGFIRAQASR
jgi:hypothetical protein